MDITDFIGGIFVVVVVAFFIGLMIVSAENGREREIQKKQNIIECVQKGNEVEWCVDKF